MGKAERDRLRAKSTRLWAEGRELLIESNKLRIEGCGLLARGNRLRVRSTQHEQGDFSIDDLPFPRKA